jgi:hypothetical protein
MTTHQFSSLSCPVRHFFNDLAALLCGSALLKVTPKVTTFEKSPSDQSAVNNAILTRIEVGKRAEVCPLGLADQTN